MIKCPHCSQELADYMPKSEMGRINEHKREALAEAEGLRARLAELEPKLSERDTLAQALEQAKAEHEQARSGWNEEREILGAGITEPEGVDYARIAYGRLPTGEGAQRPALKDWLANREALPRAVRAYLPDTAAPPAPPAPPAPTPPAPAPRPGLPPTNAGVVPFTGAPAAHTPQSIAAMSSAEFRAAFPTAVPSNGKK